MVHCLRWSEPCEWWHDATEPYGPDGRYGRFLSYMLVLLPLGWLAFAALFSPRKTVTRTCGIST